MKTRPYTPARRVSRAAPLPAGASDDGDDEGDSAAAGGDGGSSGGDGPRRSRRIASKRG